MIILPGLDGTDLLLHRFIELAPKTHSCRVLPLPDDPTDNYETLRAKLLVQIRSLQSFHLVAESFSGPVAILLAHQHPELIDCLTLVASFADSPMPRVGRLIPWSFLVRLPMPRILARHYFVGDDRQIADNLIDAIGQTSPATLANRIRLLRNVNVCAELAQLRCPIQYIRPTGDRLVPQRCVDRIANANGRVSIHEIDGPHLIMQTRPEPVWSAIVHGDGECPVNNAML